MSVEAGSRSIVLAPGQHVAGAVPQALAVFELLQLSGRGDLDVRIGADSDMSARRQEFGAREDAVAETGLGDRTQACDGAGGGEPPGLVGIEMRRVDEAPAASDRCVVEEPGDRTPARPGNAILDLLHLLGGMDVDGSLGGSLQHGAERVRCHRAEAVRGDADHSVVERRNGPSGALDETKIALDVADEAPLSLVGARRRSRRSWGPAGA